MTNMFKIVLSPPHADKQALRAKKPKKLFDCINYLVNMNAYIYILT